MTTIVMLRRRVPIALQPRSQTHPKQQSAAGALPVPWLPQARTDARRVRLVSMTMTTTPQRLALTAPQACSPTQPEQQRVTASVRRARLLRPEAKHAMHARAALLGGTTMTAPSLLLS